MMGHAYNPRTLETEAGVSLGSFLLSSKSNSSELKHTMTKAQSPGSHNNNKSRDKVFNFSKFIIYEINYVELCAYKYIEEDSSCLSLISVYILCIYKLYFVQMCSATIGAVPGI